MCFLTLFSIPKKTHFVQQHDTEKENTAHSYSLAHTYSDRGYILEAIETLKNSQDQFLNEKEKEWKYSFITAWWKDLFRAERFSDALPLLEDHVYSRTGSNLLQKVKRKAVKFFLHAEQDKIKALYSSISNPLVQQEVETSLLKNIPPDDEEKIARFLEILPPQRKEELGYPYIKQLFLHYLQEDKIEKGCSCVSKHFESKLQKQLLLELFTQEKHPKAQRCALQLYAFNPQEDFLLLALTDLLTHDQADQAKKLLQKTLFPGDDPLRDEHLHLPQKSLRDLKTLSIYDLEDMIQTHLAQQALLLTSKEELDQRHDLWKPFLTQIQDEKKRRQQPTVDEVLESSSSLMTSMFG